MTLVLIIQNKYCKRKLVLLMIAYGKKVKIIHQKKVLLEMRLGNKQRYWTKNYLN